MKSLTTKINIQYSILQTLYWAAICATNGYSSIFLLDKGFTNSQIGITIALANIIGVILQPIFATIADRSPKITLHSITAILLTIGAVCFLSINFISNTIIVISFLFIITTTFYQTTLPLLNSISVYYTNKGFPVNFGFSRSMGSVSYAVLSSLLGILNVKYGCGPIFYSGFAFLMLTTLVLIIMPIIKSESNPHDKNDKNIKPPISSLTDNSTTNIFVFFLKYKCFSVCLIGVMLIFLFHNMLNSYMIHVVTRLGGNSSHMGIAISIAAMSELPAMVLFSHIKKYFKNSSLIIFSAIMFALKAFLTSIIGSIFSLYLVQLLQALSFAIYTPASIYFVNDIMDDSDKFKGQAIITASVTLSGVFGCLLGGVVIDNFGILTMLRISALLALLGALILILFAPRAKKHN